ncbi:MAG: UDP-N-acetylmuramate--L-alanine ligase [Candidatus Omnitrophica bacterium]|nr:UDP-N-acetylmuramate--L-alanine ligase [Candidatus Omnitrophota bacterium]
MNINLTSIKHMHMIGIGGIGMSGLASILSDRDIKISGSDLKNNNLIGKLKKKGCTITIGHGKINGSPDAVVRSFSIKDNNPEIIEAKNRKIPVFERMDLLKSIIESKKRSIAVSGTHGKTTTTAMISYVLDKAGLDPTVLVGGEMDYFEGNAKSGQSDILVSEVDESDGLIKDIKARYSIITNLEKEHMEHYKNMRNLLFTFRAFAEGAKNGIIFYNNRDRNIEKILPKQANRIVSVGFSDKADIYYASLKAKGLKTEFTCFLKSKRLGRVVLNVPGAHNAFNALMAIACALEFGIQFDKIKKILESFKGVKRRFEIRGTPNDITLIEDYAHHPTEIKAVLEIARTMASKKVIAIFQPHRYSRTSYLKEHFASAFQETDELILTDIYAASEKPIKGFDVKCLYNSIKNSGTKKVQLIPKNEIPRRLKNIVKPGDVLLVLGAGDINGIISDIKKVLKG